MKKSRLTKPHVHAFPSIFASLQGQPQAALCINRDYAGAPSAPRNLRISELGRTSATVCFDAPQFPSSCPTRYEVSYSIVSPPGAPLGAVRGALPPLISVAQGGCTTLSGLQRGTRYSVSAQSVRQTSILGTLRGGTTETQFTTRG
jgi:hypothetical protein